MPTLPQGRPDEIGFPLVVKAAAGGGGRGMRVVRSDGELEEALAAARREAEAAFGDATVFCERYLERPRHVEAQLLGHAGGDQRPRRSATARSSAAIRSWSRSPPLPGSIHWHWPQIEAAASAFAEAIGYAGAGTAEFLVDGPDVYFLELNGRIQVEHPVTEAVTGLDIVELQLRVAAGERDRPRRGVDRPRDRGTVVCRGSGVVPAPGRAISTGSRCPRGIRVDAGVEEGDEVGTAYDPLLAKLIAHGADTRRGDREARRTHSTRRWSAA